jgi:uncharacterized protein (TIGR00162 family)
MKQAGAPGLKMFRANYINKVHLPQLMSAWSVESISKAPKLRNPVLIEGLPGIGNVGKIAVDFLVDELKASRICRFFSYTFPHSVFVNDKNMVELPSIDMYYKLMPGRKHDLLFLAGDVQPIDEVSCYEFSQSVIDAVKGLGAKEIVTLGGIGLSSIPKKPKVFCTGNSKAMIKRFKAGSELNEKLYGVVGPIIGVSGLLVGLSTRSKVDAIALLAETFGHPMYLGVKGAREILKVLNQQFSLRLNLDELDNEIAKIEKEVLRRTGELSDVSKKTALSKLKGQFADTNYIG